jgi:hypothetical protein
MNVTVRRTLMVCVLAGALALALALLALPKPASAAPPIPPGNYIVEGACDFPVLIEATGKFGDKDLPGGRAIVLKPGFRATLTNLEDPTHKVTYVAGGVWHQRENFGPGGGDVVVATGRNLLVDPGFDIFLTIGRYTFISDASDPIFANITQLEGHGRIIDVCARLA